MHDDSTDIPPSLDPDAADADDGPGTEYLVLSPAALEATHAMRRTAIATLAAIALRKDEAEPLMREMMESEERLAWSVVRHAHGAAGAPSEAELRAQAEAHLRTLEAPFPPGMEPWDEEMEAVFGREISPDGLLSEAGLELYDRDVTLVDLPGRGPALRSEPVPPATALTLLEHRALGRAAAWALGDMLAAVETDAAEWYFHRWSVEGEDGVRPEVRAREWVLADHATLGLGMPVMAAILERGADARWPARQRLLAAGLARSVTGVFELGRAEDDFTPFVSARDGARYTVIGLRPSDVERRYAFGRLIPLDDGTWLTSAGMEAASPKSDGVIGRVILQLEELEEELPPAVALEALISLVLARKDMPRDLRPVRTADQAERFLESLRGALVGAGMYELAGARPIRTGNAVLDAWTEALEERVRGGRAVRSRKLRREQKEKKRKRKR